MLRHGVLAMCSIKQEFVMITRFSRAGRHDGDFMHR
jgi:hypothetical protein